MFAKEQRDKSLIRKSPTKSKKAKHDQIHINLFKKSLYFNSVLAADEAANNVIFKKSNETKLDLDSEDGSISMREFLKTLEKLFLLL